MKSHANLWPGITSFENLYEAFRRARLGKRARPDVAAAGGYRNFIVHEPARRKISAAPFRDRVVHHALCAVVEPVFDRVFLPNSFANRVGKGTHRALYRCRDLITRYPYALKADAVDPREPRRNPQAGGDASRRGTPAGAGQ